MFPAQKTPSFGQPPREDHGAGTHEQGGQTLVFPRGNHRPGTCDKNGQLWVSGVSHPTNRSLCSKRPTSGFYEGFHWPHETNQGMQRNASMIVSISCYFRAKSDRKGPFWTYILTTVVTEVREVANLCFSKRFLTGH